LLIGTGGPGRNDLVDEASEYAASIERLRSMDITTVYPGHGEPFELEELWRSEVPIR
jgi:glyoxylase-like metal-dependent hydrolase (beta-lactamase superfamily II)